MTQVFQVVIGDYTGTVVGTWAHREHANEAAAMLNAERKKVAAFRDANKPDAASSTNDEFDAYVRILDPHLAQARTVMPAFDDFDCEYEFSVIAVDVFGGYPK